jgi:uncharacterized protein DUF4340
VVLGALLAVLVRAPVRPRGLFAVRGHRVFAVERSAVRGLEVVLDDRRLRAERTQRGWEIDGRATAAGATAALDDLLDTVVGLRAIDAFRSHDRAPYGLDRPRGTIELVTARGRRRLLLGSLNSAGSALYARREGDPRVLLVGTILLAEVERVFYARERAPDPAAQHPGAVI